MNIIKKPSPNFGSRDGNIIKYICVHIMASALSNAENTFANPTSEVSANYGVALTGEIHQYVDDDKMAWANGGVKNPLAQIVKYNLGVNQNKISLSIENEGFDLTKAPETQLAALVGLIQYLGSKYNIPLDRAHIIGHYEVNSVTRPNCPSVDKSIMDTIVKRCQVVTPPNSARQLVAEIKERIAKLEPLL